MIPPKLMLVACCASPLGPADVQTSFSPVEAMIAYDCLEEEDIPGNRESTEDTEILGKEEQPLQHKRGRGEVKL